MTTGKRTYMLLNKLCTCPSCSFHRCCFVTNWMTARWAPIESVNRSTSCHLSLWHVTWEVPISRAWGPKSQAVGLIFFGPVISHWAHLPHYTISQCSPLRTEEVEKNISRQRIITLNCPQSILFALSTSWGDAALDEQDHSLLLLCICHSLGLYE